jgi:GNAT superfamily N-acetyltransferase
LHGDEVIGYATLTAVPGSRDAEHVMTAVKREWRRRGVATALKVAQLRAAKAAGFAGVTTFNELRNDAMRAINERFGYTHVADQLRMRGPLS